MYRPVGGLLGVFAYVFSITSFSLLFLSQYSVVLYTCDCSCTFIHCTSILKMGKPTNHTAVLGQV